MQTRLAQLRVARGLTQVELAERSSVSLTTVRRIERDEVYDPGVRTLGAMAHALGCGLEDICEDSWLVGDLGQLKKPRQIR